MSPSLPSRPDLAQIKRQAKELLKAQKTGSPAVCDKLRRLPRFAGRADDEIFRADVKLSEAQHATAKDYGFENWIALRRHLEGRDAVGTLHVTWHKPFAEQIRAIGAGDTTIWQDPVVEGPAPLTVSEEEWWDIRRRFWVEAGVVPRDVLEVRGISEMDKRLLRYPEYREVVIWSDSCLFDQTMLIRHLDWFSRRDMGGTRLSFVCGDECPIPAAENSPEAIHEFLKQRQEVTPAHVGLARKAWRAFRSPDPTAIKEVIAGDCSALPYLADALVRHLERFPSVRSGLCRYEQETLDVLAGGRLNLEEATRRVMAMEERPFGDSLFVDGLRRMVAGPSSLIEADGPEGEEINVPGHDWTVAITATGRDVLAGTKDFIRIQGVDRWIGGVHLTGGEAAWRWDGEQGRLAKGLEPPVFQAVGDGRREVAEFLLEYGADPNLPGSD